MARSTLQRLVDSGLQVSEMSRQQAESVVRQLVQAGEVQRRDAEDLVQRLLEMGRETTLRLAAQVEAELLRQIRQLGARIDDLEARLDTATLRPDRAASAAGSPTAGRADSTGSPQPTPAGAKKSGAKKSGAKKSGSKKSGSKKSGSKKTGAKKTGSAKGPRPSEASSTDVDPGPDRAARTGPPVGVSGVRRVVTTRAARDAG